MAYNPFGEDTGVEDFSNKQETDEERKKRLARIATLVTGQAGLGDVAGQMLGERVAPIQAAIEDPQAALKQRFGEPVQQKQPVGPVMPEEVAQERAPQLPAVQTPQAQQQGMMGPAIPEQIAQERAPQLPVGQTPQAQAVSPEQFQQIQNAQNVQLPQAGEGTQVAANTNVMPKEATVSKEAVDDIHHKAFIDASNSTDPKQRQAAFAALIANPNVPEGLKAQANQQFVQDWQNQRGIQQANEQIKTMGPNDYARALQAKDKEGGSYLKAILLQRLGLTELAQQEQEKISPTLKAESMLVGDQRYTAYRNRAGEITKAYDSSGKEVSQDEVARLAAEQPASKSSMFTGGSKIFSIPKGDANEGNEYTARFNTHTGKYENIITTGPNAGKQYTGAPGLEKRVETNEAITANKTEASKNLINFRLAQNLKYAGPMAYTRAGASYVGKYNAENGTNLGYNHAGALVDHNTNQPVVQNKDGSINATQRPAASAAPAAAAPAAAAPAAAAAQPTTLTTNLGQPPAYDNTLSPLQNKKIQDNWAANRRKVTTDFITGKQGQTVQSLNVAVDHLDTLADAAKALNNGDVKLFNQVANAYSKNTGEPAVTDFNALKTIVGSEVAKAVAGGATALGDREEIRAEINAASSEKQLLSAINKYQRLMAGQVNGLRQTYVGAGLPEEEFNNKLLPRTKKVLGEAGGSSESVPTTPAERARAELERRKKGQP
jgi:hypothetical protein